MRLRNVTDLRDDLLDVYEKNKAGQIEKDVAAGCANIAGKIMKSAIVELDYNRFMKLRDKKIPFLEG